ncbi:MAG: fumarylacetoacetate hydrolase family protein [Conexibacteraceae bacterium]|nr:fumarylacetoacetate hydrolase family protein [Conexibacteraceae bacterium]
MRVALGPQVRVVGTWSGQMAIATVDGAEFEDLPELLEACGGDAAAIHPGVHIEPDEPRWLSVVGNPGKVICIGLNYRKHAEETGASLPARPMLFPKWASSLTGPYDDVPLPPESELIDWESELAFVFGRSCRRVKAADAAEVVFGYTLANDVSMRDFQRHTTQFTAGKAWDRSTPVGPALIPAAELGGVEPNLAITGRLNGDLLQDSRTDDLIFGIPQLVEYITTVMTMQPGDIVLTGTPSGVGMAENPPRGLAEGDVYEVEIEGIGRLVNRFVAEQL